MVGAFMPSETKWLIERWMDDDFVDEQLRGLWLDLHVGQRLGDLVEGAHDLVGQPLLAGHRNIAAKTVERFTDGSWSALASVPIEDVLAWPDFGPERVRAVVRLLVDGVRGNIPTESADPVPAIASEEYLAARNMLIEEAATWAVLQGCQDLATAVAEARELPDAEQPQWLHELFLSPAVDLVTDPSRFDPYALLTDFLSELDDRSLDVLEHRLAVEPARVQTLGEIGKRHGVSGERIRVLESRHIRQLEALAGTPAAAPLAALVSRVARDMGDLCPVDLAADEVLVADDTLTDELIAYLAGPYILEDEWYRHVDAPSPSERVLKAFDSVADESSVSAEVLTAELVRTGTVRAAAERLIAMNEHLRLESGSVIDQRGHGGDRAVALLRSIGHPMSVEDLHARLDDGTTQSSLRNRIGADPRLQWVGIGRVGLTAWGDDEWGGVFPAMLSELDAAPGPVRVEDLAKKLGSEFGVAEASVSIYATTHPALVEEKGWVRRRREDEPYVADERIDLARDCRFVDGRWAWRVPVDHDLLRGSGRSMPEPFAALLDLRPGSERTIEVNGHEVKLGWSHYPTVGSLRAVALDVGAEQGQLAFISLDGDGGLRFRTIEAGHDDESLLWSALGWPRPVPEQSWLEATAMSIGLAAESDADAVIERLRKRKEKDVAAAAERLSEAFQPPASSQSDSGDDAAAADPQRKNLDHALRRTLASEGITSPVLPAFVVGRVGKPVMAELWQPWSWCSDEDIEPMWCYRGVPKPKFTVQDRYWVFAHRGVGENSHGIGLICRSGPLLLQLQARWGGANDDPDRSTADVNAIVNAWNRWWPEVEQDLDHIEGGEITVNARYSNFRETTVDISPGAPEWLAHAAQSLINELQRAEA